MLASRKGQIPGWRVDYDGLRRQSFPWGVTNRVKNTISPYRSPIKFEVGQHASATTARDVLVLLFEAQAANRMPAGVPRTDATPGQGWSDAQMILTVLVLNIAGFDRVSEIEHLDADAGLCAVLKRFEPKLLGMSRRAIGRRFRGGRERCFPSARLPVPETNCMNVGCRRARAPPPPARHAPC